MLVEKFVEVKDSLCVGQSVGSDERIILFLKMANGYRLVIDYYYYSVENSFTDDLVKKVKSIIRQQLSARHVPSIVLETTDIPVS